MTPARNGNAPAAPVVASSSRSRRKSFAGGLFSRPILSADTSEPWRDDASTGTSVASPLTPVRPRPKSLFGGVSGFTEVSTVVASVPAIPGRRVLTKTARPKSIFGSLTSSVTAPSPTLGSSASSVEEYQSEVYPPFPINTPIIHAGEVVTGGGLLRKKKEYMVITARELLKYKSETKANEAFGLGGKSMFGRSSSVASVGESSSEHS